MAKAASCACGWHLLGTEEELVEAFVKHVEKGHGKQISREAALMQIKEEVASFLYFDGCLGHAKARPLLEEVLAEEGITDPVRFIRITDRDDAIANRFQGSPTIRIANRDIVEQADTDYDLRCRIYWVNGRAQDFPSKEMIRAALRTARIADRPAR